MMGTYVDVEMWKSKRGRIDQVKYSNFFRIVISLGKSLDWC